jgi:hypothetical protein
LIRTSDGKLIIAFTSNRLGSSDVYITESSDDGKTWSSPVKIAGVYPAGDGGGPLLKHRMITCIFHTIAVHVIFFSYD